jgi:hypothetical protein
MSTVLEAIDRLISRLYTAFILRDLTFLVSGAMVITIAFPKPLERLATVLSLHHDFPWLSLIAFLALSYVLGVVLQELARFPLEWIANLCIEFMTNIEKNRCIAEVKLFLLEKSQPSDHVIPDEVKRSIERIAFIKQIGGTQASALLAVLVICIFRPGAFRVHPILIAALIFGILLCSAIYVCKSLQQAENLEALKNKGSSNA